MSLRVAFSTLLFNFRASKLLYKENKRQTSSPLIHIPCGMELKNIHNLVPIQLAQTHLQFCTRLPCCCEAGLKLRLSHVELVPVGAPPPPGPLQLLLQLLAAELKTLQVKGHLGGRGRCQTGGGRRGVICKETTSDQLLPPYLRTHPLDVPLVR